MIRVRIAPSPTGHMHVGTAQSALYNWLFAHKNKGAFVLRIEDTDRERSSEEYEKSIVDAFDWLGLKNNEFYKQSQRAEIYKKYLETLLKTGKAFRCYHTKEELEEEQNKQKSLKEAPRHLCNHKEGSPSLNNGGVIRLAVDSASERKISFKDIIRGEITWDESLVGDFVIAKDLNNPLYNYAVVIDDIDMNITHVIRGEDHISNTPKQILIYEALGKKVPEFAHLPLILAPDRSKLSKRHGAVAVVDYKKDYLPEAIINFLGALSYTFSKEILSKEEMLEEFELGKIHKSGAIFDIKKLNWLNSQYIKRLPAEEFKKLAEVPGLPDEAVPLITDRLEKLTDVHNFNYFWQEPEYDKELLKWKKTDLNKSLKTLAEVKKIIEGFDFKNGKDDFRKMLDEFSVKIGDRGLVYWPLRVALTGRDKSPDPVDVAFVLGKEKTLERVGNAISMQA